MNNVGGDDTLEVALAGAAPQYTLPNDPFARNVLVPALKASSQVDLKMGYFTSGSFAEIAPGLASFVAVDGHHMRLIVSPAITDVDFDVLTMDSERLEEFARDLFLNSGPTENDLVKHTLECLAWMLSRGRLEMKIAVMRSGIFHPKIWIFKDGSNVVAAHGSSNLTQKGLGANRESITIHRDWRGEDNLFTVQKFRQEFDDLWGGGDDHCKVLTVPDAVKKEIIEKYKTDSPPTGDGVARFWAEIDEAVHRIDEDVESVSQLGRVDKVSDPQPDRRDENEAEEAIGGFVVSRG